MKVAADWGKAFFRKDVFFPGDRRHVEMARPEAAFLVKALGLKRGDAVLDVCCGTGRHSLELARRGVRVTGVDVTAEYLREARRRANGGNVEFLRGDMRKLPFEGLFDAAINLWTSFGYFLKESDDRRTLAGIARSLKPGGRFLIDIIDADFLRTQGIPKNWSERDDGSFLLEDFQLTEGKDAHATNTWTIVRGARKPLRRSFFTRAYDYDRLAKALRKAGLKPVKRWGGLDGKPYKKGETHRLVVLAKKWKS